MSDITSPQGLISAVPTPFASNNVIDEGAFREHLQWLYNSGIKRILVSGTTGEFFSLTSPEKQRLLKLARLHFSGHIMFHAGACCLKDTISLIRFASAEGAHSIAAILPFYLADVSHNGLVGYLQQASEATSLPFIIYNFPKHTQVAVSPKLLAEVPHFGIKDSQGDLSLISHTPNYFIGSDRKLLEAYQNGAAGFISARANAHPELYAQMDNVSFKNAPDEALALHQKVCKICDALNGRNQIEQVKTAIAQRLPGYPTKVRLPL